MKLHLCLYGILICITTGCGKKLSGESEKKFISSKEEVEKSLDASEKENLEKALRVIALYAMSEKWNNSEVYSDQSINDITLEVIDGKTYGDLIDFAEEYLSAENQRKIERIEQEIADLIQERKNAQEVINTLQGLDPINTTIIKGSWDRPTLQTQVVNNSAVSDIETYTFVLQIFSISKNKKVDDILIKKSAYKKTDNTKENIIGTLNRSIFSVMERSRRLTSQLEKASYPISDIEKYDLRIILIPQEIITTSGTVYAYPEKSIEELNEEIELLRNDLTELRTLQGTLAELELEDETSEEEVAFNNKYLKILEETRESAIEFKNQTLKTDDGLSLTFPLNYEVKKQRHPGMYSLALNDSLVFSTDDKNLIQYHIRDTTYVEYDDMSKKSNGILNVLVKPNVTYNLAETIDAMKDSHSYYDLIDADDTGYIYVNGDRCKLLRYFRRDDTHYLYDMDFPDIDKCIVEFDRSKNLIL